MYTRAHVQFVFLAFRSMLVATLVDLLAVMFDRTLSRRLIAPIAVFLILLAGYIVLLTNVVRGGPGSGAIIQVTGQKVTVYAAILTVIIQSVQLRQSARKIRKPRRPEIDK